MSEHPPEPRDDDDEPQLEEQDLGDTELDRDDTHGLADEVADRAEGHS